MNQSNLPFRDRLTALPAGGAELVVDNFAGGGGASMGIERAIRRAVDIAINHDLFAIRCHAENHPNTKHLCESIFQVDPEAVCKGKPVGLAWFSPDCTHFSNAKGGQPRKKEIRGLAWIVLRWAGTVRPRVICLENVREFLGWGPLTRTKRPRKDRKGETFDRWLSQLEALGYTVEHRILNAADYGACTSRERLFLVARCDGQPIVWPEPTHGPGRSKKYRHAAEVIDWSLPCPSIFDRRKPLVPATMKRIANGLKRFVFDAKQPFIISIDHQSSSGGYFPVTAPLKTITTENRFALVSAFLSKYYGNGVGNEMETPVPTITAKGQHIALAATFLTQYNNNAAVGHDLRKPLPTITANYEHFGEVRAFLIKYYGQGDGQDLQTPLHTITTRDRFGLVQVNRTDYQIADIGMRMLSARELASAQGFPEEYVLPVGKSKAVNMIGNSVCPDVAQALVTANYCEQQKKATA